MVPLAAPVHAVQNASLPTVSLSNNLVVSNVPTGEEFTFANPSTNAYAINTITITAPANWNFSSSTTTVTCPTGGTPVVSLSAIACTGLSILPGFSGTLTVTAGGSHSVNPKGLQGPVISASSDAPIKGTFTTSIVDAESTPAAYPGPSFSMWSIFLPGTLSFTAPNNVAGVVTTSFVAGSSPVTTTVSITSGEPGVPITLAVSSGSGTLSTTSVLTSSTGTASFSFAPTNTVNTVSPFYSAIVNASVLDVPNHSPASALLKWTTVPTTPSEIAYTFTSTGNTVPSSGVAHYINTPAYLSGTYYADIASGYFSYAISDMYANAIPGSDVSSPSGTFTATNGFWNTETSMVSTPTYTTTTGTIHDEYDQPSTYGSVGLISASFTGTYKPTETSFTVSGSTGQLFTSTLSAVLSFGITCGVTSTSPVCTAGVTPTTTGGAGSWVIPQLILATPQAGVPVTFNLCANVACPGTSSPYTGKFASNGLQSITVATSITSPSDGNASAHYDVDTTLKTTALFNATVLDPIDGTPTNVYTESPIGPITTVAGSVAQFGIFVGLATGPAETTSDAIPGATLYVNVFAADEFGNLAGVGLSQQVQVSLSASAGVLSVSSAYIADGCYATNGTITGYPVCGSSFGTISWTLPTTIGTVATLTVSGAPAGVEKSTSYSVTVVSTTPTLSVTSPVPVHNVIYSSSSSVVFQGQANVSLGYPNTVLIKEVGYKLASAEYWVNVPVTQAYQATWGLAATLPQGISTLTINATDTDNNVAVSAPYTVLVDSAAPTFTIGTPAAGSGSDTVTVTSAEGDFNTSTFAATYGGSAVPSSSVSWSGTQTLGSPSTLTATISGLTAGTNTLAVSGSTDTDVAGSASSSITITVIFADSITFTTSGATWGTSGAASGVFVPVTNSWSTNLQLTIYATLKSGGSIYVLVGGETLTAGQTGTVFLQDFLVTVPAGTYSATFSAITTANQAVSAPTTPITVTVP